MSPQTAKASAASGWIAAERGRFSLWLPVYMAAGVIAYFSLTAEPPLWLGIAIVTFGLVGTLAGKMLRPPSLMLLATGIGLASAQFATWRAPPLVDIPTRATIVTGTVRAVEPLPQGRRILIAHPSLDGATPLPRSVRIRLRVTDSADINAGDTVRVRAMLQKPASPAYPGAWDLQRDAYFAGLAAYGYALNPSERLAATDAPLLQSLRETIARRISSAISGSEAAIGATLLTGSTAAIPEPDRAAFRDSGLAHLLAIAGLHIGIVMGLIFGATRLALAIWEHAALHWRTKQISALTAIAAGGFYMLLTGAHVPIIRSFAMACLVTLGVLVGRRAISLRGLALAMTTIILIAPAEVLGVSFQMSFSAVLALIAGYAALRPLLSRLHGDGSGGRRVAGHIVALALTSALAGTASSPYGAYHFGHIQLYYVFANMLAVPLTAFWVMPLGLVAMALMPLHLEAIALVPMGWGLTGIAWIAHAVAAWPAAVLAVPHIPAWGLGVLSLGIAWLGLWRSRLRLAGIPVIALGIISPSLATSPDILISADASLIAAKTPEGMFVQKTARASRFTLESWQQYWAETAPKPFPTPVIMLHGAQARILRESDPCGGDVALSAEPIRQPCPEATIRIDRFSVWRQGAHAVWLGPTPVVLSDRGFRGERPWVTPLPTRGRIPPGSRPALTDALSPE